MEVSVQRHASAALPPEKTHGTHFKGGRVGPRACLNGCGNSRPPSRDSIPGPPLAIAISTTLSHLSADCSQVINTSLTLQTEMSPLSRERIKGPTRVYQDNRLSVGCNH